MKTCTDSNVVLHILFMNFKFQPMLTEIQISCFSCGVAVAVAPVFGLSHDSDNGAYLFMFFLKPFFY